MSVGTRRKTSYWLSRKDAGVVAQGAGPLKKRRVLKVLRGVKADIVGGRPGRCRPSTDGLVWRQAEGLTFFRRRVIALAIPLIDDVGACQ